MNGQYSNLSQSYNSVLQQPQQTQQYPQQQQYGQPQSYNQQPTQQLSQQANYGTEPVAAPSAASVAAKQQLAEIQHRSRYFYCTVLNPKGCGVYLNMDAKEPVAVIPLGYTIITIGPHFSLPNDKRIWMRAVFDKPAKLLETSERYVAFTDDGNNVSQETLHLSWPSIAIPQDAIIAHRLDRKYKRLRVKFADENGDDEEESGPVNTCFSRIMRMFVAKKT